MSLLLNIDTSAETAAISLAENGTVLDFIANTNQKDHAGFLHEAVKQIIEANSFRLDNLDAIAVVNGPGSYTGLRVGMASAKGFCYALNIPFITVGSLNVLAKAAIDQHKPSKESMLYCPLIDARRMEVFTCLFDASLNELSAPGAMILDENSFKEKLDVNPICFFGSGANKFESILDNKNAFFLPLVNLTGAMAQLSFLHFSKKKFTHLVDSEPFYIKDFYSSPDLHNKI